MQGLNTKLEEYKQQASELRALAAARGSSFLHVQAALAQSLKAAREVEGHAQAEAQRILSEAEAVVAAKKIELQLVEEEIARLNNELSSLEQRSNKVSAAQNKRAAVEEAGQDLRISGKGEEIVCSPGRGEPFAEAKAYSIQLFTFLNASHYVAFAEKAGPIHSHSWQIRLKVDIPSSESETIPFTTLTECINSVFTAYEGKVLNELRPFNILQPTTENMAMYFYNRLEDALAELKLGLDSISLWETPLRGIEVSKRNNAFDLLLGSSKENVENLAYRGEIAAATEKGLGAAVGVGGKGESVPAKRPGPKRPEYIAYRYALHHYAAAALIINLVAFLAYYPAIMSPFGFHYPWGSDAWGHLFKAEFLYEQILKGNYFPQFTEYWYNGVQPFRYWAPLPYYFLALLRSFSADIFMAGNYFIFGCALGGGLAWLFFANRLGLLAATLGGVIWSVWLDNVRIAFSEGNLPRVLAAALLPLLFAFFLKIMEEGRSFPSVVIFVALLHGVILAHAMFGAIFAISLGLFAFFLWFLGGCGLSGFLRGLLAIVLGVLSSGWWLLPALVGGITGINAGAVKAYVAENLIPAAIALDPFYRFANREAFYWGISIIFALTFIALNWRAKPPWAKSLALCGLILIAFTFPSLRFLYVLFPLSHLLWPYYFSGFAAFSIIASSLAFYPAPKWAFPLRFSFTKAGPVIVVIILATAFLLDSFFSVRLLAHTSTRAPNKLIASAELLQAAPGWRVATIDLSKLGSAPSYLLAEQAGREQVFGWAWQGAATSPNIMLINTGLQFQYYPFLFRSCVLLGATDLLVKDDVIKNPQTFALEAEKAGYSHIVTIDGVSIWRAAMETPYLVEVRDEFLAIGEHAPTVALLFPRVEMGVSTYLDSYDLERLKKYSGIILYGAKWSSKTKAEQAILDYAASGGEVFVELTGMREDVLAKQPEFLGVYGEPVALRGQLELVGREGEAYLLEPFFLGDTGIWQAWVLQGLEEVELEFTYFGMSAPVYGSRLVEGRKIYFLGGNLPYHAFLTKDALALELLQDIFAVRAGYAPVSLIPLRDYQASEGGYVMSCSVENEVDVVVPVAALEGTKVKLNGRLWPYEVYENLLRLKIPAGDHEIIIYLERPPIYRWGAALSLLSLLFLGCGFFYLRKRKGG